MKKTIRDIDWAGKRAVMRCDFNVPLDGDVITDDTRIKAALPSIEYLLEHGASIVLMSHLGRPKGEAKPEFSLAPVAKRLSELLGKEVKFVPSDVVVDDDGFGELVAAVQHAVAHSADFAHILDDALDRIGQEAEH